MSKYIVIKLTSAEVYALLAAIDLLEADYYETTSPSIKKMLAAAKRAEKKLLDPYLLRTKG